MMRISFWIVIIILGATSCGYHSSFQKQKYLKGNLKQTFGDHKADENVALVSSDSKANVADEIEQEIEFAHNSYDETIVEGLSIENPIELKDEKDVSQDFQIVFEEQAAFKFTPTIKKSLRRSTSSSGEDALAFLVLFFLILAVLSLILLIWLGPWAFLISFGCQVIAFLFFLWFLNIATGKEGLVVVLGGIVLFPAALIILLLTMLVYWIVSLF